MNLLGIIWGCACDSDWYRDHWFRNVHGLSGKLCLQCGRAFSKASSFCFHWTWDSLLLSCLWMSEFQACWHLDTRICTNLNTTLDSQDNNYTINFHESETFSYSDCQYIYNFREEKFNTDLEKMFILKIISFLDTEEEILREY